MKTFYSALTLSLIAFAAPALAASKPAGPPAPAPSSSGDYFKPYAGVDYQYTSINYDDIPGTAFDYGDIADESLHGVNLHVGARVHRNLGFEAGYLWTRDGDKNLPGGSTSVNVKGFNFDVLGYLPTDDTGKLELIGTVGVSRLKAEATGTVTGIGTASTDDTETKPRFGIGAQYWLADNVNARGILRYQGADFDDTIKSAMTANLGLNFQF